MWRGPPGATLTRRDIPSRAAPLRGMAKDGANPRGSDFLTCPLPVDDLSYRRFAIRVGGGGWMGLGRRLEAGVEEAVCEVGVLL